LGSLVLGLVLAACGKTTDQGRGDGPVDATDGGCQSLPPSDPLFECPATFAAHDVNLCASGFPSWAGTCGAYKIDYRAGLDSFLCVYDSQSTLIAARHCTDHNVLWACGGFCRSGGQTIDVEAQCDLQKKLLCAADAAVQ
jgi:hypothetical protein